MVEQAFMLELRSEGWSTSVPVPYMHCIEGGILRVRNRGGNGAVLTPSEPTAPPNLKYRSEPPETIRSFPLFPQLHPKTPHKATPFPRLGDDIQKPVSHYYRMGTA